MCIHACGTVQQHTLPQYKLTAYRTTIRVNSPPYHNTSQQPTVPQYESTAHIPQYESTAHRTKYKSQKFKGVSVGCCGSNAPHHSTWSIIRSDPSNKNKVGICEWKNKKLNHWSKTKYILEWKKKTFNFYWWNIIT